MRSQRMSRAASRAAAAIAASFAALAWAGTHLAFKPIDTSGIKTFRGKDQVGQILFSEKELLKADKAPKDTIAALTFKKGEPPAALFTRAYYPATVGEMIKTIPHPSRDHQMTYKVYLRSGDSPFHWSETLAKDQMDWNTELNEFRRGEDVLAEVAKLPPGEYKVTLWLVLGWEEKLTDPATGKASWEGEFINVARGELTLTITE